MTFFTLCIAVLLTQGSPAAFRGHVVDATGLPLPGVSITIKGADTVAITDDRGDFTLTPATFGPATLLLALPGFLTQERAVPAVPLEPFSVTMRLAPMTNAVNVRATASTSPTDARLPLTPLDVVRTAGAQADLMRALSTLPGITEVDEGAGLFVRGGDVSEVLVLLDGVIVSHPYRYESPTGGFRGAVDPFLTQGAAFTSGGFSAAYGNVMSAVVDLTTLDKPRRRQMTITAGLAGVSFAGAEPLGARAGLRIAANRTTPRLLFALNDSPREFDRLPGGWDLSGSAYYESAAFGRFRIIALTQHDHVGVQLERDAFAGFLHSGTQHLFLAGKWERALLGAWGVSASIGSDDYTSLTDVGILSVDQIDERQSGRVEIAGLLGGWRLRTGLNADLASASVIGRVPTKGGDFGGVAGLRDFSLRQHDWHSGAFVDASRTIGHVSPSFGARLDHFDRGGHTTVDPRLGLRMDLAATHHLSFAFGHYHQAPPASYFDAVSGVGALPPMRAIHYVAGYEYGSIGQPVFVRLEAYVKTYRRLPMENPLLHFDSSGYGSAHGIDFFVRRTWKRLTIRASTSWVDARRRWTPWDQHDRYPLPTTGTWSPDFAIPFSVTIVASAPLAPGLSLNSTWRRASGRPFTPVLGATRTSSGDEPIWAAINSDRLPRYERLDLSVSQLIPVGRNVLIAFFSIDNVAGRRNFFEYAYSADYTTRRPVVSSTPRGTYFGMSVTR